MKHILLNLKRFDIPTDYAGVNSLADIKEYGSYIINSIKGELKKYNKDEVSFHIFFQEAHLIEAIKAKDDIENIKIGSQGVYFSDVEKGKNFGAFTTQRPASAMKALGCQSTLIGHCEERNTFCEILGEAGIEIGEARKIVNQIMNKEIKRALEKDLLVVYCIGEREEEQENWQEVLRMQLEIGLKGVDTSKVIIAYEPIWSIGPGKVPADKDYITKVAKFVKEVIPDIDVTYGGGLKSENANMLASIEEISGGLIALTRFIGDIGFYPDEYLEIVNLYLEGGK